MDIWDINGEIKVPFLWKQSLAKDNYMDSFQAISLIDFSRQECHQCYP